MSGALELERALTIDETIARLQNIRATHGGDLKVVADGCDCWGGAQGIEVQPASKDHAAFVLVSRERSPEAPRDGDRFDDAGAGCPECGSDEVSDKDNDALAMSTAGFPNGPVTMECIDCETTWEEQPHGDKLRRWDVKRGSSSP